MKKDLREKVVFLELTSVSKAANTAKKLAKKKLEMPIWYLKIRRIAIALAIIQFLYLL